MIGDPDEVMVEWYVARRVPEDSLSVSRNVVSDAGLEARRVCVGAGLPKRRLWHGRGRWQVDSLDGPFRLFSIRRHISPRSEADDRNRRTLPRP